MEEKQVISSHSTQPSFSPLRRETFVDEAAEACLHQLFEAQADANAEATALVGAGERWTYGELDRSANQLARLLRFYDIGPGKLVALYYDRSIQPIVAILACLKAGAAYVPIDPIHPKERIQHILDESEAALLLTEKNLAGKASEFYRGEILVTDELGDELSKLPQWRLSIEETGVKPSDLCYVLYTSGTTGRPKGVMAEHRNAYRYVRSFNEAIRTSPRDKIYQGFSLGFDGSVEEIWMAFSNGSTLVVGTKETPRFGNDLGRFLDENGVTYFSTVPTLLSTISESIPSLRYLVVSGEACPAEIVDRWATSRCQLLNVYGPTEATVNTTLAVCSPGKPVTIGRPLPGYEAFILDDKYQIVADGEKGELYVGGETLARGYLKHPELTSTKFVSLTLATGERPTRLYRTGDLVRRNEEGELEFFGRIDGQIKIRGYRVELSEIESVLREHPSVRSSVVKLYDKEGLSQLAAYVTLAEATKVIDGNEILQLLRRRLPDYMVPSYLDVLDTLPVLASGKVDRSKLPDPLSLLVRTDETIIAPATDLEAKLVEAWKTVFGVSQVSVEADFFLDLGGHSLLAAQMVTLLRNRFALDAAIRDAYRFSTIRKFAAHLEARTKPVKEKVARVKTSREVFESLSALTRYATATLQLASIYLVAGIGMFPLLLSILIVYGVSTDQLSLVSAIRLFVVLTVAWRPSMLVFSILMKWLLIGRYRAGSYPVWGFYYFRWWLVSRLQSLGGAGSFAGTPLMSLYYRLMGARVGKDCDIDTAMCSIFDLVSVGDQSSLGADTQLLGYRVEHGMLKLGRIDIGSRCFVGNHSSFGLDVKMGDGARLDDQSLLPDGETIAKGEFRRGSPAQPAEVKVPLPVGFSRRNPIFFGIVFLILGLVEDFFLLVPALGFAAMTFATYWKRGWAWGLLAQALVIPFGVVFYCLYFAGLKRLILARAKSGVYSIESVFYVRKWLADRLIRASRAMLLPVYTTLYLPPWLRLMGAKIGPRAEMSTVWSFSPELIDVGQESFFADGCIIGGRRTYRGQFELGVNHIGMRSFVGNSAILPTGAGLGDRCLLGVASAPPTGSARTPDGTEWLGCPAFALPNRQKEWCFDEELTYRPSKKLIAQRAIVDACRVVIPGYLGLSALFGVLFACAEVFLNWGAGAFFAVAPLIGIAASLVLVLSIVLLKLVVMGRFRPVVKPLWSMYVWLNEMVNGAYESVMAPAIAPYLGTPFVAPLLRLIGCKVGRHAFIETTLFSEWDLVEIGDYAALNAGAIVQTHLFEDRVMKSSHLKIGDGCSVGNMAVVLYDTEMGEGATLAPLSLLMKGERLNPFTDWHGIPTVQK